MIRHITRRASWLGLAFLALAIVRTAYYVTAHR